MAAYEILLLNTAIPQIQAAQAGDTYVCPRDIAFSAALTLSAGTANGVPYLNGSKVVTTGSALTFDGSTLGVTRASAGTSASFSAGGQTLKIYSDSTSVAVGAGGALAYGTTSTFYDPTNLVQTYTINGSEQMRLTLTGLGIGENNPAHKLHVSGTGSVSSRTFATNATGDASSFVQNDNGKLAGALVYGSTKTAYGALLSDETAFYSNTSMTIMADVGGAIKFASGGNAERARITSGGDFYLGTQTALASTAKLQISNGTGRAIATAGSSGDLGVEGLRIGKFDNDSTTSQLFVRFTINNDNAGSGQINANGASAAAFGTYSDERLKKNIVSLSSQLSNICALRPVEFDYKDGSGHQIGFIAQEMQTVYPDVVAPGDDEMLMVTGWSKTEARLVKAIQEQQAMINELKAEVAALKGA